MAELKTLNADSLLADDKLDVRPMSELDKLGWLRERRVLFSREEREQIHDVLMDYTTWIDIHWSNNPEKKREELECRSDYEIVQMMYLVLKEKKGNETSKGIRTIVRDEITNVLSNH